MLARPNALPATMTGVVLTGHGGFECLQYRDDLPTPRPGRGEVVINVHAAGINNTDINTRTGWYNPSGGWSGDLHFPRIQGADVSGHIVAVGEGVDPSRLGERVVCDPYCRADDDETGVDSAAFLGSERDGGFAQFCAVPAVNAHVVPDIEISDAELATLPCSAGTAMNMLLMASVGAGDRVVVTGASGGVGTFLVQIARHLGADVVAIASADKHSALTALGARVVDRHDPDQAATARAALGEAPTVVADVVGGDQFGPLINSLRPGGRYVTAGAVAGPVVQLDLRTLYLRSLQFFGSAVYRRDTFPTLMRILADGGIHPIVHGTWPLERIVDAQRAFLEGRHVGSIVLVPPPIDSQM
ncbi:MAG TPA: zinc-binding dehydrogenase [Ilumatobacteraceae bacterium]|nr:zinc-binding dehydrogenase [Ilumatobacteraceae bacterium]